MMNGKQIWGVIKQTYTEWSEDKAPRLAAALSYYTLFSLAPLLVIAISVAGLVLQRSTVQQQVLSQVRSFVGENGAAAIEGMINAAGSFSSGITATIIGIVLLLLGASGFFGQLQDALNTIWDVQPKPDQGIWETVKERFFSFTMVLGTAFLLLVSLIVSAVLTTVGAYFQNLLPGGEALWEVINFAVSFGITTLIFALIFKVVPDVEIGWGDVWIGALATALLFSIGRYALALYLARGSFSSTYGAAGSVVVLLVWVYYSAQILFFGAEFTQVYARRYGSRIRPSPNAIPLTDEARATQGIPRKQQQEAAATAATSRKAVPETGRLKSGALTAIVAFVAGAMLARRNGNDQA